MTATAKKATLKGVKRTAHEQMVADFKADMAAGKAVAKANASEVKKRKKFDKDTEHMNLKFSCKLLEQRDEFMDFVRSEIDKAEKQGRRAHDFFISMNTKLVCGEELSDNMIAALRKCKARTSPAVKDAAPAKKVVMTLKIKQFVMKQMGIDSRIITGVVKAESAKAYLMEGHADMLKTMSWCMRCGKALTLPASYTIGFGETCAGHMGVPYPGNLNVMTGKARADYRKAILGVLHNQKFERWIPKSQVEEILERKEG